MTISYRFHAKRASRLILESFKGAFLRRGFGDGSLVLNWRMVVGDEFGLDTTPVKILNTKNGRILYISSDSLAVRSQFIYAKGRLIEHINRYLGAKRRIFDIKLK